MYSSLIYYKYNPVVSILLVPSRARPFTFTSTVLKLKYAASRGSDTSYEGTSSNLRCNEKADVRSLQIQTEAFKWRLRSRWDKFLRFVKHSCSISARASDYELTYSTAFLQHSSIHFNFVLHWTWLLPVNFTPVECWTPNFPGVL